VADGNRHIFVLDHILEKDLTLIVDYLSAPTISELLLDSGQLTNDNRVHLSWIGENPKKLLDLGKKITVLALNGKPLHPGQPLQPKIKNSLRLGARKGKTDHQPFFRLGCGFSSTDEADYLVEVEESNPKTVKDV
jgi:hypothetical protein